MSPRQRVRFWNANHPVGVDVTYWSLKDYEDGKLVGRVVHTTTRTLATISTSGHAWIWLEDVSGAVSLEHVVYGHHEEVES